MHCVGCQKDVGGRDWRIKETGRQREERHSGPLMVAVVKGPTSALLTKEDVLALNTFPCMNY